MDELNDLIKPVWGPQKWILEGWNQITDVEKQTIKVRMDDLFKNGLPFELKHDKLVYIHAFSLLAQLETIAIQIPLKFESKMSVPIFRERMYSQLVDEVFHSLVCTKVLFMLCDPYAFPPKYNDSVDKFADFLRSVECPKIAVVLLNLVAEGWIEELFSCLYQYDIAPKIFEIILEDEHRHVCEADLYAEIGLADKETLAPNLKLIEELFFSTILHQYNMALSLITLLGVKGMHEYMESIDKKHTGQLKKLNLTPGKQWSTYMRLFPELFHHIQQNKPVSHETEIAPFRKILMTQWRNPTDPTMVGQFNLDITCIDVFHKKYPPETLTTLMLQTVSEFLEADAEMRLFLHNNKLYYSDAAYVGLVVKLPECNGHIGSVTFRSCHELTVSDLFSRIRHAVRMMAYCYKKREQLESQYPELILIQDNLLSDLMSGDFGAIQLKKPTVFLSNIGSCGYTQAKSPLFANEAVKFTIMDVERRQVWNKETNAFEVRDQLPVSVSADHRIFDGNIPIPKIMISAFQTVFQRMTLHDTKYIKTQVDAMMMKRVIDRLLEKDLTFGYMLVSFLQTQWPDYLSVNELFQGVAVSEMELR